MNTKIVGFSAIAVTLAVISVPSVRANFSPTRVAERLTGRVERMENRITNRVEKMEERITQRVENMTNRPAHIWASLTAINGNTLTVKTKDDQTKQINVSSTTKFLRRFDGSSSIAELAVGDWLYVKGTWTDTTLSQLNADWIQDRSIQKLHGSFHGTVVSVNTGSNSFVLQPEVRKDQVTVTVSTSTKIYGMGKEQSILFSQIAVGNKVMVRGVWDRVNHTLGEVVLVKDFSVPTPTK